MDRIAAAGNLCSISHHRICVYLRVVNSYPIPVQLQFLSNNLCIGGADMLANLCTNDMNGSAAIGLHGEPDGGFEILRDNQRISRI